MAQDELEDQAIQPPDPTPDEDLVVQSPMRVIENEVAPPSSLPHPKTVLQVPLQGTNSYAADEFEKEARPSVLSKMVCRDFGVLLVMHILIANSVELK